ncbi:MAG: TIGR02147 family protein [Bdellovibrionota bacterium]
MTDLKVPTIYEYLNISDYLKDIYKYRKANERHFSYDVWAKELDFKSRGHLREIIIGISVLNDQLIPAFLKNLDLDESEIQHFVLLSKYTYANDPSVKASFGKSLISSWKFHLSKIEVIEIQDFLSDNLIPSLFTYLSYNNTLCDIESLAQIFKCQNEQIRNAIKCLVWHKLIDGHLEQDGKIVYKTTKPYFFIPDFANNIYLEKFHKDGLLLAEQAHKEPAGTRKFYSYFLAISESEFLESQKLINQFFDNLIFKYSQNKITNKKIYRFNVQLIPVSDDIKFQNFIESSCEP